MQCPNSWASFVFSSAAEAILRDIFSSSKRDIMVITIKIKWRKQYSALYWRDGKAPSQRKRSHGGNIDECIHITRAGILEYPNNYKLLNKLMYAYALFFGDDGNLFDCVQTPFCVGAFCAKWVRCYRDHIQLCCPKLNSRF